MKRKNGLSRDERELENLLRKHVVRAEFSKKGHIKYFLDNGKVFTAQKAHGRRQDPRTVKNQLKMLQRTLKNNPNLYGELARRFESPYAALATPPALWDDYDEIVLRNLEPYTTRPSQIAPRINPDGRALRRAYVAALHGSATRSNPDGRALRRAYVAAKQAALDGDPRAVVVLQELEKLLAEEGREKMASLRNVWRREAGRLRGNPKSKRTKRRHKK